MDSETKYVLAWIIPFVVLILGIFWFSFDYYKTINKKFIENGYHQEQLIGNQGVYWVK